MSLECKVVGVPTPVLRWFKDDKEIKAGDVFALTANLDDPTSLGIYTCEAVNCMGTAYSSSKVSEHKRYYNVILQFLLLYYIPIYFYYYIIVENCGSLKPK